MSEHNHRVTLPGSKKEAPQLHDHCPDKPCELGFLLGTVSVSESLTLVQYRDRRNDPRVMV